MNWRIERELDTLRKIFERTGNPHYAWRAIDFSIKKDLLVLPPWLMMYLAQCSERMLSDEATRATDLRKVLPWALGFPKKHGPGKPLNPYRDIKQLHFTLEFGRRVLDGEDPVTARREACNAVFSGKDAEVDDKTLVRRLLRNFDLKKAPRNAKQWEEVAYKYLAGFLAHSVLARDDGENYEEVLAIINRIPKLFCADKVSRDSDVM